MPRKERPSRLDRALQERMYFISHIPPSPTTAAHNILVTGQSGNLYTVTLPTTNEDRPARCNCVDHCIRRTLCKHMLFTLLRVLKLPRSTLPTTDKTAIPLLTTTLLPDIEAATKRIKCAEVDAPDQVRSVVSAVAPGVMGVREEVQKRDVKEGDECPICFEDLLGEKLVYCGFGCGNGVHEECFKRYRQATEEPVRCVLCRSIWEREDGVAIGKQGLLVGRRLVNVANVVPHAFVRQDVRRLGLDKGKPSSSKAGSSSATGSGCRSRSTRVWNDGVAERITKTGPSDRELRMRAREERRRLEERNSKETKSGRSGKTGRYATGAGMQTRSRRSTGA